MQKIFSFPYQSLKLSLTLPPQGKNLGTGRENQIFFLRTPATLKFFLQIVQK